MPNFQLARGTKTYNGSTKPQDWLIDYATAVKIAGGNLRWEVRYVPQMLEGPARVWLNNLPAGSINCWLDFEEMFVSNFTSTYKRPNRPQQLAMCKQRPNETDREFLTRWCNLRNSCEGVIESQAIAWFAQGCRYGSVLWQRLQRDMPTTLAETIRIADSYALGDPTQPELMSADHREQQDHYARDLAGSSRRDFRGRRREERPDYRYNSAQVAAVAQDQPSHGNSQRRAPNRYSPSQYGLSVASKPTSYRDAEHHPEWQLAMAEEIAALERTGTWDLVSPPPGVRPITCKWVYKIKTRSDGSLERYKARLVARGFQQEHGRDYDETFAPVAHMTTVRTLLAVASVRHWSVSQLDVQNAFLNGELSEEVYMQPPPGYSVPEGMVCRLRRSLYGLKQAPRAWFERFASVVTAAGFSPSAHDPALFVHTSPRGRTLLLLYVDDMIITGDDPEYIAFVKARLRDQFLMTDLGPLRYFLGIEVSSTSDGFYISQEKYIQDLLARAALGDERTVETPMELNVKLQPTDGDPLSDPTRYRHLVGSLVYLAVTRPDISYPVHILSQFVSAPTTVHYSHLLRVLRYLRGTITRRLFFPRSSSLQLQCYSDATWASDPSDRRSLSAYCVFLGGSLIAWKTKKQTAVSRSSVEAELRAMALLTAEVTWLRWLLADFGVSITTPTLVLSDSTGAISVARDPVKHELTKHIGVDAFYTRAQVQAQVVALQYVPSDLQLADFFTKAQTRAQHDFLLSKLSVVDPP
mgnify:CR=1 FL=1